MKNVFLLLFLTLFMQTGFAQTYDTTRVTLSGIEFEKLKSDFSKISKTKLFRKSEKAKERYLRSLPFMCSDKSGERLIKCLQEKLGDEKAKAFIKLSRYCTHIQKKLERRFPDTYSMLKKTSTEQKIELMKLYQYCVRREFK